MKCQVRTLAGSERKTVVEEWGTLTWLASGALTGSPITVGRVVLRAGKANVRHCHDTCEEVLHLLRGRIRHSFGDQSVELRAGDTLVIRPGVMHHGENFGDEDAEMIISYSTGNRDFRKEA